MLEIHQTVVWDRLWRREYRRIWPCGHSYTHWPAASQYGLHWRKKSDKEMYKFRNSNKLKKIIAVIKLIVINLITAN